MIKIGKINHFGLSVANLDKSIKFYEDILGIPLQTKRETDAFFQIEDTIFALLQYPAGEDAFYNEMKPKNKGKAFTHFGFSSQSSEDVFNLEKKLKTLKVPILKPAYERWDGASLYFLDPNGYTLEFLYFKG